MIHRKKNWGHRTSKIIKSRQSSNNGHLPYHLLKFYDLARALMHDVAREFACAQYTVAPRYNKQHMKARENITVKYVKTTVPTHDLPRHNEYFALSLAVRINGMMIEMVDRPNTTPIGQDRETLTFKALLSKYLNVAVHAQVCRLLCVVYPIVQLGPAWSPRYDEYFFC